MAERTSRVGRDTTAIPGIVVSESTETIVPNGDERGGTDAALSRSQEGDSRVPETQARPQEAGRMSLFESSLTCLRWGAFFVPHVSDEKESHSQ